MSDPIRFLNALAQALSTMALYSDGHPHSYSHTYCYAESNSQAASGSAFSPNATIKGKSDQCFVISDW